MDEFLEKPTFTIGQVWFEFVKRLPRTSPRYRLTGNYHPDMSQAQMFQAMSQAQMNAMQAQQQQYQFGFQIPLQGSILGNLWGGVR